MDTFGKSDPYFKMYKESDDGQWVLLYTSAFIDDNHNPTWKAFDITIQDYDKRIKIQVYDKDVGKDDDEIGTFIAYRCQLKAGTMFELPNDSGRLCVERFDTAVI